MNGACSRRRRRTPVERRLRLEFAGTGRRSLRRTGRQAKTAASGLRPQARRRAQPNRSLLRHLDSKGCPTRHLQVPSRTRPTLHDLHRVLQCRRPSIPVDVVRKSTGRTIGQRSFNTRHQAAPSEAGERAVPPREARSDRCMVSDAAAEDVTAERLDRVRLGEDHAPTVRTCPGLRSDNAREMVSTSGLRCSMRFEGARTTSKPRPRSLRSCWCGRPRSIVSNASNTPRARRRSSAFVIPDQPRAWTVKASCSFNASARARG